MFENDKSIQEGMAGGFYYDKRELRVCLFLHKIQQDEFNPLSTMNTISFMLGVPATNEIGGMITLKNPAKPPTSYKTWKISKLNENETRKEFVARFWNCWKEAKESILNMWGDNISIMYEGRLLDGGGYN